ncbi:hypothetical protein D3C87_1990670 [compost metagenome]
MSDRPTFTTNHADIDAALNSFIDLLPPGCRELFPAIEDALLALETATDKDAARQHLAQTIKPLQALIVAASPFTQQGPDHD